MQERERKIWLRVSGLLVGLSAVLVALDHGTEALHRMEPSEYPKSVVDYANETDNELFWHQMGLLGVALVMILLTRRYRPS